MRRWLFTGLLMGALVVAGLPALAAQPDQPAPCDQDTLARLKRHRLGTVEDRARMDVVASACKPWPFDESIVLAVAAFGDAEGIPGERRLHGTVAMLSAADGDVLASHVEEIEEDATTAVQEGAYRLDTARYDLADGMRAFGVVFHSSARGASCPEGGFDDQLTLFVREGTRLRPVLSTYLDAWRVVSGSVCGSARDAVIDTGHTVLRIEPTRQHGWADITLTTRVQREAGADAPHDRRTAHRTLRYNGTLYQLDPFESLFHWSDAESTP